ncbi:MAG: NCS2 family permease [Chloroflexota bacterium]|nr:NCS2 family permease [Chloroflexota bacterium]
MDAIARYFRFNERRTDLGTELRAGLTTFMVMAYIIAVNPLILSIQTEGQGPPLLQTTVATALTAGILCLAMGLVTNYPFALAAGLGLNAVVAFDLILNRGFRWEEAMAVIVWEGIIITILVLTGFRRAIMDAIPLSLKRAIAVGIGLFILFIGLVEGGFVQTGAGTPVRLGNVGTLGFVTFAIGLAIALALMARGIRGALLISIIVTTVVAVAFTAIFGVDQVGYAGTAGQLPGQWITPFSGDSFSTLFAPVGFMFSIFTKPETPMITVILVIFSLMLSDFFDTMGTVIGVGEEAGLVDERGQLPGIDRVLVVDSVGAALGGLFSTSSNTTYIESAAGVSEGGRTGLTAVVVGILFLLCILIAPVVGIIPAQATAPALVVVGYLMFTIAREIEWTEIDDLFPALATMIVMPLTYSITNGIAAGFVTFVFLKLVTGRARAVHPLLWVVAIAFVIYFAIPWLQGVIVPPPPAT